MLIKLTQTGKNAHKKKPITNPRRYHLIFHYLFSNFPSLFRSFHSNGKYYTYYHILYMHTEYDTYLCFSVRHPPPLVHHKPWMFINTHGHHCCTPYWVTLHGCSGIYQNNIPWVGISLCSTCLIEPCLLF